MKRRDFLISSAAALGCAGYAAPASLGTAWANEVPTKGGTLIWGHSDTMQNIDIHQTGAASSLRVLQNIHASIVNLDHDFKVVPGLAEKFEVSTDGLKYTFHLRKDVKFHNGAPMTSADVKYSFDRIRNPASGAVNIEVFSNIISIDTPDDYTVIVTLEEVYASFLSRLSENGAGAIIPKDSGESQGTAPVGAGPFKFVRYEPGSLFEMERFAEFWGEPAYLDKVIAKEVIEPTVRLTGLQTGELQLINEIPSDRLQAFEADTNFKSLVWNPWSWDFLNFNHELDPFRNKNVRLAIDLLIDKEMLLQGALWGQGTTTASPSYPKSPSRDTTLNCRLQDIDQARKLLEDAGYAPGELKFEIKVANNYQYHLQAAQIMAEWFREVGIELKIIQLTWSDWLTQVGVNKDFQIAIINMFTFWEPDFLYYGIWHSKGFFNFRHIKDPVLDKLVEEARVTIDDGKRNDMYKQVQKRIFEEVLDVILWFSNGSIGAQKNVMGLENIVHPNGSNMSFHRVWING